MKATEILSREHQVILRMLVVLEHIVDAAMRSERLDKEQASRTLEFFSAYADECHHGKEEDLLFPRLVELGLPGDQGPIAVMMNEHEIGRTAMRGMRESLHGAARGEADVLEAFRDHAHEYVNLLRDHIAKEDHVLFPLGEGFLGEGSAELAARFADVDARMGDRGPATQERLADEMCAHWHVTEEAVQQFAAQAQKGCAH